MILFFKCRHNNLTLVYIKFSPLQRRCQNHTCHHPNIYISGAEIDLFLKSVTNTTPWAKYKSILLLDDKHICILQAGSSLADSPFWGGRQTDLCYIITLQFFPLTSPCMYKFPSASDYSCLSDLHIDTVYHWAALDYFHMCLFYTVCMPKGLVLRFTCLTDVCGN